jgi:malonate transporter
MITILANALVPIFAGLLLGYIAGLRGVVDNKNVKSLITFVMSFALPCSLFVTIARTPHSLLWSQGKVAVALAIVYFVIFGLTHFAAQRLGKNTAADSTVLALTLGFPNAAAVGLPLLLAAYGNDAVDHSSDPRKQHGGGQSLVSNDTHLDFSVESD